MYRLHGDVNLQRQEWSGKEGSGEGVGEERSGDEWNGVESRGGQEGRTVDSERMEWRAERS